MNHEQQPTADELKAQLDAITQEREALTAALARRREEEKSELAGEIRDMISARGYDLDEVIQLVQGRKRRRTGTAAADANASYQRYADPDNPENVYVRGRMPNWLIEKMAVNGFDPANAEHRAQFKSQHLVQLAA